MLISCEDCSRSTHADGGPKCKECKTIADLTKSLEESEKGRNLCLATLNEVQEKLNSSGDELAPGEALIDNSAAADKIFDNALRIAADVVNRELRRRDGSQQIVDKILALQRLGATGKEGCTCGDIAKRGRCLACL